MQLHDIPDQLLNHHLGTAIFFDFNSQTIPIHLVHFAHLEILEFFCAEKWAEAWSVTKVKSVLKLENNLSYCDVVSWRRGVCKTKTNTFSISQGYYSVS